MRIDILGIKLHDRLKIYTSNGLVTGVVVDILESGIKPDIHKVLAYYQINTDHKHLKAFCSVGVLDRLIIKKDNGDYFVLPRTNKADRYLLDIQRID